MSEHVPQGIEKSLNYADWHHWEFLPPALAGHLRPFNNPYNGLQRTPIPLPTHELWQTFTILLETFTPNSQFSHVADDLLSIKKLVRHKDLTV